MFGVFVAISSRSDIATQAHRSCQGLLGLFSKILSFIKPFWLFMQLRQGGKAKVKHTFEMNSFYLLSLFQNLFRIFDLINFVSLSILMSFDVQSLFWSNFGGGFGPFFIVQSDYLDFGDESKTILEVYKKGTKFFFQSFLLFQA